MSDTNIAVLLGRLTSDPEAVETKSGTKITKFSIAVNRKSREGDEVSYFDVKTFKHTADFVATYLLKGSQVAIEGRLSQERWEGSDGTKRSKIVVIANSVQGLGSGEVKSGKWDD